MPEANVARRNPGGQRIGRDITRHHGPRADDRAVPDGHAREDGGAAGDPHVVAHRDGAARDGVHVLARVFPQDRAQREGRHRINGMVAVDKAHPFGDAAKLADTQPVLVARHEHGARVHAVGVRADLHAGIGRGAVFFLGYPSMQHLLPVRQRREQSDETARRPLFQGEVATPPGGGVGRRLHGGNHEENASSRAPDFTRRPSGTSPRRTGREPAPGVGRGFSNAPESGNPRRAP